MSVFTIMTAALLLTIVIELGVLLLLREQRRKVLVASVAMNIVTNVPLNLYAYFMGQSVTMVVVGETLVVVLEAAGYYLLLRSMKTAAIYSLLCNAISFLLGLLLNVVLLHIIFNNH